MTGYVLIHGSVFPRQTKEPFEPSGKSIRGALEYDRATDRVRCHECGEWYGMLAPHLKTRHLMGIREYRLDHGLAMQTALCGAKLSRFHRRHRSGLREFTPRTGRAHAGIATAARLKARQKRSASPVPQTLTTETRNLYSKCHAQLLARVAGLSRIVGRTPTLAELRRAGISQSTLEAAFGSVRDAMLRANLEPRTRGVRPGEQPRAA